MNEAVQACQSAPVVQGTLEDLRRAITARDLDPDRPARWAWDPWPDRHNAGRYRGRAGGTDSTPAFMAGGDAPRLLEAHLFWNRGGAEHHLLVLPLDADGRLCWHWKVPQATAGGSP